LPSPWRRGSRASRARRAWSQLPWASLRNHGGAACRPCEMKSADMSLLLSSIVVHGGFGGAERAICGWPEVSARASARTSPHTRPRTGRDGRSPSAARWRRPCRWTGPPRGAPHPPGAAVHPAGRP